MAGRIRAFDWSKTELGAPETWPQALRTCVRLMLNTKHPVFIFWGPNAICLYNDGYLQTIGPERDAIALGNHGAIVWDEIWDVIGPQVAQVLAGGEPTWYENHYIPVTRYGERQDAYWTYSYSPIDDEGAPTGVGGTLVLVSETTQTVLMQQRQQTEMERLRTLFDKLPGFVGVLTGPDHVYEYVNDAYMAISGPRDFIGRSVRDVFPELAGQGFYELLDGVFSTGKRYVARAAPIELAGEDQTRYIDLLYEPIRDVEGRVTGILVGGYDVTEHQQAADSARRGEEQLRLATDAAEMAFFDYDTQTQTLFWTPRLYAMYGMMDGRPVTLADSIASVHPDDVDYLMSRQTDAQNPEVGVMGDLEYRVIGRDDGVLRWLEARGQGIFDAQGTCIRVLGTVIDVTERKLADVRREALVKLTDVVRESSDAAELAYAASGILGETLGVSRVGFGTVDPKTDDFNVERDWNAPGVESIAGVLNLRDFGTFVDDLKAGRFIAIDDVTQDRRTAEAADALIERHARSFVNVPVIEQDKTVGVLYINFAEPRDWSAEDLALIEEFAARIRSALGRLGAEKALQDLAASLEQQVEDRTRERDRVWRNSQDAILVVDGEGTFREVNPAFTKILGWEPSEVIGQTFFGLLHPEDIDVTADVFAHSRQEDVSAFVNRFRHKDGSYRHLDWVATPEGGLVYAYGRDVTAEQEQARTLAQIEDALRQAQKMEAVGQLTGGIAHDFNNMLAVVLGSLELITRRTDPDDAMTRRQLGSATEAAKRAATLTQRLLAFSRQQPLRPEAVDANKLVGGMSDLLRHSIGADIRLETVLAGGLWKTNVDPNQLESAILNLAVNARDAMPDGGRITIETQNASLDQRYVTNEMGVLAGQYILVAITDTGTGMPESVIAKAFDPFFTTKEVGKGTGLGLSQVYGFVKQSGGHVKIYSELGQGTTIKIYLPRGEDVEVAGPELPDEASSATQLETILVVDDEDAVRDFSVDALTELGYRVIAAENAVAALKQLAAYPEIALLFTDIVMPDINGRKLADQARRVRPDLKVLYTTGYTRNAVVHNGIVDKGAELIGKPFTLDELASRVRHLLDAI